MSNLEPQFQDLTQPAVADRWDVFVRAHPAGHPTDLSGWRLLYKELFGLESVNFAVESDGEIQGIASAYLVCSPFFGRLLVTSPYFGYGGLLAPDAATREALVAAVEAAGSEHRVDFLEWRLGEAVEGEYQQCTDFLEFGLPLDDDPEKVFNERLRSNVRQNIRKARNQPLRFSISADPVPTWRLVSRTIRDLGTPFHRQRFFELLVKYFPDEISFSEVHLEENGRERLVAAGVLLRFRDTMLTPYIGSLRDARHTNANYLQYWGIVEHCIAQGIRTFHFGRSPKGSTHERFKRKWGCESVPLSYSIREISGRRTYRSVTEASALERFASRSWSKMPLALTRRFGHLLFRSIP